MAAVATPTPVNFPTGTPRTPRTPHTPGQNVPVDNTQSDPLAEAIANNFMEFLETYVDHPPMTPDAQPQRPPSPVYIQQLHTLKERMRTTLYVDYEHIMRFNSELAIVADEFIRFEPILRRVVSEFVGKHISTTVADPDGDADTPDLTGRNYWLSIYNLPTVRKLRDLRSEQIGMLTSISGTVTRTSEVRPELLIASFTCTMCDAPFNNVEQQFRYTEPPMCQTCQAKKAWKLEMDKSTFVDWQRVRVQENAQEIPPGSMPRTMDVILRNDNVESAKAGDKVILTGSLVVIPDQVSLARAGERVQAGPKGPAGMRADGYTGVKQFGVRELVYRTAYLACHVAAADEERVATAIRGEEADDETFESVLQGYTRAEQDEIAQMKDHARLYQKMVSSIAPTVYGHDEVKRGILLMLFGGVHKETKEGISLRGDVNVCIVGDPSTAKSQFLKYVVNFLPRAVYASGKASSAAGLTASVAKDHETGEFCIEAGALMLADNGICCIDEFDKMDIKDQVAIHEAMEQQTISISKAGIQATLNARTSILAAANPIGGRYDRGRTLKQNLTMTAPIMSRFDLFFVVLDECEEAADTNVARFIIDVHRGAQSGAGDAEFSKAQLQRYIRLARKVNPVVRRDARQLLVESYKKLRQADATGGARTSYRITVRQLESLIRLSEALARLHLDDYVRPAYVREAVRLLRKSIIHVETEDVELAEEDDDDDDDDDDNNKGRGDAPNNARNVETEGENEDVDMQEGDARKGADPDSKDPPSASGDDGDADVVAKDGPDDQGNDSAGAEASAQASGTQGSSMATGGTDSSAKLTMESDESRKESTDKKVEKASGEKMKIGFNEFRVLMNKVVVHLRKKASLAGKEEEEGACGSRKEIIEFLLEDTDAQGGSGGAFDSEEALVLEAKRMRLVVNRMIKRERVLVEVPNQGDTSRDDRVFRVHPNYVVE